MGVWWVIALFWFPLCTVLWTGDCFLLGSDTVHSPSAERRGLNALLHLPAMTEVNSGHVSCLAHTHTPGLHSFCVCVRDVSRMWCVAQNILVGWRLGREHIWGVWEQCKRWGESSFVRDVTVLIKILASSIMAGGRVNKQHGWSRSPQQIILVGLGICNQAQSPLWPGPWRIPQRKQCPAQVYLSVGWYLSVQKITLGLAPCGIFLGWTHQGCVLLPLVACPAGISCQIHQCLSVTLQRAKWLSVSQPWPLG